MHLALIALIPMLAACGGAAPTAAELSPSANAAPAPGATDVAGLKTALAASPAPPLIDVRTPGEYAGFHVPGAVNIPLDQLESRLDELSAHKAGDIYLICAVGGRSAKATQLLAANGFARPINVEGGSNGWKAAGYPTE